MCVFLVFCAEDRQCSRFDSRLLDTLLGCVANVTNNARDRVLSNLCVIGCFHMTSLNQTNPLGVE